jgi:hypothetical protein
MRLFRAELRRINQLSEEREKRYEQRFADAETATSAALAAAEKAVTKAEIAADKRFESVNEFRQALTDQTGTFITRVEAIAIMDRNTERIQELADRLNKGEGHTAGTVESRTERRLDVGQMVQTAGLVLLAVSVLIAAIALH